MSCRIVLVFVAVVFLPGFAFGQLTIEDVRSGYRQNKTLWMNSSFLLEWDFVQEFDQRYVDATKGYRDRLLALKDQASNDVIRQNFELKSRQYISEKKSGLSRFGEFYWCDNGLINRTIDRATDSDRPEFPDDLTITSADSHPFDLRLVTFANGQDAFSVCGYDASTGNTYQSILGFEKLESTVRPEEFYPFRVDVDGLSAKLEGIYKSELLKRMSLLEEVRRPDGQVELEVDGAIAKITFKQSFPSEENALKLASWTYMEVELNKGFLPRLLKETIVLKVGDKALTAYGESHWPVTIRFENKKIEGAGFYPAKIIDESIVAIEPLHKIEARIAKSSSYLEMLAELHASPVEEDFKIIPYQKSQWTASVRRWDSQKALPILNMERVDDVVRFMDMRSGEVRVSAGSQASLEVDLDRVPGSESNGKKVSGRWIVWFVLGCISVAGLYMASRKSLKPKVLS